MAKGVRSRKPVAITFVLLALVAMIYFMTGPSDSALGLPYAAVPYRNVPASSPPPPTEIPPVSPQSPVSPQLPGSPEIHKDSLVKSIEYTEMPFMPQMENATLKAELGRASWRLFHTVLARYPEKPTPQEQATLKQYLTLFAQVYPCGDCARHFIIILNKNPPQVSSRVTASMWGCMVHNLVNKRLDKPQYDCTTILEDYDCGCGGDSLLNETKDTSEIELVKEGRQRGG